MTEWQPFRGGAFAAMVSDMHEQCPIDFVNTPPALAAGNVHLWRVPLNVCNRRLSQMLRQLSSEERDRAGRFRVFSKQQQFIVARSQLRTILGHYLNLAPQTLQFQYTHRGKPILASAYTSPYSFNLAHSQQLALIAIAIHSRIGVDIESIRPIQVEALAKRFLQPKEVEWLSTLAPEQRQGGFFRLWTCKEAYLKATGEGLAGLHQVQVTWDAGLPVLHTPSEQYLWSLQEITVGAGFVAALVVEGQPPTLQWFDALCENRADGQP